MLDIENFETKFEKIVNSDDWQILETEFKKATNIFLFGEWRQFSNC